MAIERGAAAGQPTLDGNDLAAVINMPAGATTSDHGVYMRVPPAPLENSDQVIYLFSALSNTDRLGSNAVLNVLGWNMFNRGTQWTTAVMALDDGGNITLSRPIALAPGDGFQADMISRPNSSGLPNGTVTSWVNNFSEQTISQLIEIPLVTSPNYITTIAMMTYGVDSCAKLPAGNDISGFALSYAPFLPTRVNLSGSEQASPGKQKLCDMHLELNGAYDNMQGSFSITYSTSAPEQAGRSARLTYSTSN